MIIQILETLDIKFFYDYGIIGVILLYVFYILSFAKFDDYRCMLAAIIVMTLVFGVDAFVIVVWKIHTSIYSSNEKNEQHFKYGEKKWLKVF